MNITQLKLMGLLFMILDHLYYYFEFANIFPLWFRWIGRLAFPIFLFANAESYYYTSNKKKYMLRLLIGAMCMIIINFLFNKYLHRSDGFILNNNIFATLFMINFYLYLFDKIKENKTITSDILYIVLFFITLPISAFVEYGSAFVAYGFLIYFTRNYRHKQIICFSIISLSLIFTSDLNIENLLFKNYQWMMVFSVIFFKLYNEQKGKGLKYLFYVFYPVHIYLLYVISYFIMMKGV